MREKENGNVMERREEEWHHWKRVSYKKKQRIFERERDSWLGRKKNEGWGLGEKWGEEKWRNLIVMEREGERQRQTGCSIGV